jgi:hypothetical protein
MKIKQTAVFISLLTSLSLPATAESYIGISGGKTEYYPNVDKGTSFEITGGVSLTDNFAIQASYIDFGEIDHTIAGYDWWGKESLAVDAIEIAAIGRAPITQQLSIFGLIGIASWDSEITYSYDDSYYGSGSSISSIGGTDWVSGIGVNYKIKDNTSIEFRHKRYDLKNEDSSNQIKNTAVGIKFSF